MADELDDDGKIDIALFPHTTQPRGGFVQLQCTLCGKACSSFFTPVPTDTPDRGLIVRAIITCPECIEKDDH